MSYECARFDWLKRGGVTTIPFCAISPLSRIAVQLRITSYRPSGHEICAYLTYITARIQYGGIKMGVNFENW